MTALLLVLSLLQAPVDVSSVPPPPGRDVNGAPICPTLEMVPAPGSCSISADGSPSCAPGAVETDDLAVICHQRTTARRCHFDAAFRRAMARAYGMDPSEQCETDHVLSLELGGSNDVRNLAPQRAPDCHMKDAVEDRLHAEVCSGRLSLAAARIILLGNWREFFAGMHRVKRGLP